MAMTIEQQRALAIASARLRLQQQPQQPETPTFTGGEEYGVTPDMITEAAPMEGFARGAFYDPVAAVAQVVGGQEARKKLNLQEQQYQEQRAARGETGMELSRLGGSILSPLNIIPGAAAAKGVAALGGGALRQAGITGVVGAGLQPLSNAPEDLSAFLADKVEQLGAGALIGALTQSGLNVAGKLGSFIKELATPATKAGKEKILRDKLNELAGPERDKIVQALQNAEEIVAGSKPTASQALANIPEGTQLSAFEQRLAKSEGISPQFAARQAEQQAARQAELGRIAGTPEQLTALKAEREAITAPMRQGALEQANIAGQMEQRLQKEIAQKEASRINALQQQGQFQTMAAEQNVLAQQPFYPVPGLPRVASKYSPSVDRTVEALDAAKLAGDIVSQRALERNFKQLQLNSLEQNGFFPLKVNELASKVDSIKIEPGMRSSDVVQKTFNRLKEKLTNPAYVSENGLIDSRDLYTIRKEIGNDIATFAKESGNWDAKLTAGLEKNIKSYIDNAIQKSGGADWKNYLSKYSEYSKQINQREIGMFLQDKLKSSLDVERAGAFTQAVRDASSVIKRPSGAARYGDVKEVLTESQLAAINRVSADLQRASKAVESGRKTSLGTVNVDDSPELPQLLSRTATVTNALLKALKKNANTEINQKAAQLFADPKALATFMSAVPKTRSTKIVEAIYPRLSEENRAILNRTLAIEGFIASEQQPNRSLNIQMETGPGAMQ